MAREGFQDVANMGIATGMLLGGAAAAYQRGVNRAVAWQNACDAEAIRQDEVGAFQKLLRAFRAERSRAETAEARVKALETELNNARMERIRLLQRRQ